MEKQKEAPFFLYLALTTPHANNEAGRKLGNGQEVPDLGPYTDRDWTEPNKGQAAMISRMDADIGRLFALLKQLGLDEKTLVFFASDNGPHKEGGNDPAFFNASGGLRGIKRALSDGGIRVPFLARWPGRVKAGVTSTHVGYFGDLMATLAELTAPLPKARRHQLPAHTARQTQTAGGTNSSTGNFTKAARQAALYSAGSRASPGAWRPLLFTFSGPGEITSRG